MVDLNKEIDKVMLEESWNAKKPDLFNDGKTTFKQLRDVLTSTFGSQTLCFTKSMPKIDAYLTMRDGNWYVSSYLRPKKSFDASYATSLHEDDCGAEEPLQASIDAIVEALESIDTPLLNRFFANGSNRLHICFVCPPIDRASDYGNRCIVQYGGIDCFNGDSKAGEDKKSSFELYRILKSNKGLQREFSSISPEQLSALKRCKDAKATLEKMTRQLARLVDGLGWGCTIQDYVYDRYARYLVNKALVHSIDISKNSDLARELTARLSGVCSMKPTKSDLATFAKREGIDVKSSEYKDFLSDIENDATQTRQSILLPVESIVYTAILAFADYIVGYASLDPSITAQKFLKHTAKEILEFGEDNFEMIQIDAFKKLLAKVRAYIDAAPGEIKISRHGTPYVVVCDCKKFDTLQKLIG